LYVEENGVDPKKWYMHWRTDGNWHQVDYVTFGKLFGFAGKEFRKFKIHNKPHLPAHQMKFMYLENATSNYGKVSGLYSYYSYLNRMIKKPLCQKMEIQQISLSIPRICLLGWIQALSLLVSSTLCGKK